MQEAEAKLSLHLCYEVGGVFAWTADCFYTLFFATRVTWLNLYLLCRGLKP